MRIVATCSLLTLVLGQALPAVAGPGQVSPQGILLDQADSSIHLSPGRSARLRVESLRGGDQQHLANLHVSTSTGAGFTLAAVRGNGFLISDVGRVVVLETTHSNRVPTRLTLLDLQGRVLDERLVEVLSDARLSTDGARLAYRCRTGLVVVDLRSLAETRFDNLDLFRVDGRGRLAGVRFGQPDQLVLFADGEERRIDLDARPRRIAFAADDNSLLVLTATTLGQLDLESGTGSVLMRTPPWVELRDLRVRAGEVEIGARQQHAGVSRGARLSIGPGGSIQGVTLGSPVQMPSAPTSFGRRGTLPWPLQPNSPRPVGNSYGEYQNYGGSPYLHPGIDVLGADNQPVYAVAGGKVKAVLTTSAQYHWRVAISNQDTSGTSEGYLYAHLDFPTIAVNVGDTVVKGQYLGNLVPWPVAGFTHCHFARIEDSGNQWYGDWLCTDNPHLDFEGQNEGSAPFFQNARSSWLFAFARNQSSNYRNPNSLTGKIDIIARVGDQISSTWVCSIQQIRYTIHPQGNPQDPIVDNRLAIDFDMALDTYQGGPIDPFLVDLLYKQDSTCNTQGDYSNRDFYHILTNSNGDSVYTNADLNESWDTTLVPNGNYVVEVTALDAAGNATTASMTVTVAN